MKIVCIAQYIVKKGMYSLPKMPLTKGIPTNPELAKIIEDWMIPSLFLNNMGISMLQRTKYSNENISTAK